MQIDTFTGDYAAALARAVALDQKIMGDASKVKSSQYADIVSLATRQTMGALDITVGNDSSGKLVPDDIMVFMKNMGTDQSVLLLASTAVLLIYLLVFGFCGNSRANPVEHIYMAFPALMYLNASLGGALLSPLLASQPASLSGQTYAAQDLGNLYPQAQGPGRIPRQGVERECAFTLGHIANHVLTHGWGRHCVPSDSGSMLTMMLAHARISGDGTLLSQYVRSNMGRRDWRREVYVLSGIFYSTTRRSGGRTT